MASVRNLVRVDEVHRPARVDIERVAGILHRAVLSGVDGHARLTGDALGTMCRLFDKDGGHDQEPVRDRVGSLRFAPIRGPVSHATPVMALD